MLEGRDMCSCFPSMVLTNSYKNIKGSLIYSYATQHQKTSSHHQTKKRKIPFTHIIMLFKQRCISYDIEPVCRPRRFISCTHLWLLLPWCCLFRGYVNHASNTPWCVISVWFQTNAIFSASPIAIVQIQLKIFSCWYDISAFLSLHTLILLS